MYILTNLPLTTLLLCVIICIKNNIYVCDVSRGLSIAVTVL